MFSGSERLCRLDCCGPELEPGDKTDSSYLALGDGEEGAC